MYGIPYLYYQTWTRTPEPSVALPPDVSTEWWLQPNEPYVKQVTLATAQHQAFFIDPKTLGDPPTPGSFEFYPQPSEPYFPKALETAQQEAFLTDPETLGDPPKPGLFEFYPQTNPLPPPPIPQQNLGGLFSTPHEPPEAPDTSTEWKANYPDFLLRRKGLIPVGTILPIGTRKGFEVDWIQQPDFPYTKRKELLTAQHQAFFSAPEPTAPSLDASTEWIIQASEPLVKSLSLDVAQFAGEFRTPEPDVDFSFDWWVQASEPYLKQLRPNQPLTGESLTVQDVEPPPPDVSTEWQSQNSEPYVKTKSLQTAEQLTFFIDTETLGEPPKPGLFEFYPQTDYNPTLRRSTQNLGGLFSTPEVELLPSDTSTEWLQQPSEPYFDKTLSAAFQQAFLIDPNTLGDPPKPGLVEFYPETNFNPRREVPRQNFGGLFLTPEVPVPPDVSTEWKGNFPDQFFPDHRLRAAYNPSFDGDLFSIIDQSIEWYVQYHNPTLRVPQRNYGGLAVGSTEGELFIPGGYASGSPSLSVATSGAFSLTAQASGAASILSKT